MEESLQITGVLAEEKIVTVAINSPLAIDPDVTEVRIVLNGKRIATLAHHRIRAVFDTSEY